MGRLRQFHFAIAITTAMGLATSSLAQEPQGQTKRPGEANAAFGNFRERLLKEFDADGDGKLSEEEQARARAAASRLLPNPVRPDRLGKAELMKQFDQDGDGQLNADELAAVREFMARRDSAANAAGGRKAGGDRVPAEVLKRFDKDGDGKLSEQERQAATKARQEYLKRTGDGDGRGRPGSEFLNREEMVKRFDKNGDGQLDNSERTAARAAAAKLREQRAVQGVPGAGGEARRPRIDKQKLLEKFDADGDGKLNDQERAKARDEFQKRNSS